MTVDSRKALWRPIRSLLPYGRIRSKCEECSEAEDNCECRKEDTSPPATPTWKGQLPTDIPRIELGLGFGGNARSGTDEILNMNNKPITISRRAGSVAELFVQRHGSSWRQRVAWSRELTPREAS